MSSSATVPGTVYGIPRGTSMREVMARQTRFYGAHHDDVTLDGPGDRG
ncbi:hypothetical protein ABZ281_03630 [Streptomyces sp. NPDC006265]